MAIKVFLAVLILASIVILCINSAEILQSSEEYQKKVPKVENNSRIENLNSRYRAIQDSISKELERYMSNPNKNFLPAVYKITNLIQNSGIDIRSISVTNRDGSPSLDLSGISSPVRAFNLFRKLNDFPHYLDIRFFEAQRTGRTLKINLTLFPSVVGSKEENRYPVGLVSPDTSYQQLNALFGIFPIKKTSPAPLVEPERKAPRSLTDEFIHIGDFNSSSGRRIYAIKSKTENRMKNLSVGKSDGSWTLISVENNVLVLRVDEDLFYIGQNKK